MFIFSDDKMQHFPKEYSENASLLTFMDLKESIVNIHNVVWSSGYVLVSVLD